MILGFRTHWPNEMGIWSNQPTLFVEKITESIRDVTGECLDRKFISKGMDGKSMWCGNCRPKLHTIREDRFYRWQEGNDIHFFINVRKKNMFRFAPVVKVKAVQQIEIKHSGESWRIPWVMIDGVIQTADEINTLALNDGFESREHFFAWFSSDFKGKIIHWTDIRY